MTEVTKQAIAIVGCGCKVPGADNLEEFWRLLERGENHVIEIPKERWNHEAYYDEDRQAVGKTYAKNAGLLKDPLAFDNKLFNIPNVEADQMDPQQRYVLECVYRAMEDGGITRDQLKGTKVGVYVGAMNSDYRGQFTPDSSVVSNYILTGVNNSLIAARVSYVFDFRGPAMTIDTACSSALIAVYLGVQALRAGDCDIAVCGGVNFILTPDVFIQLARAGMASAGGQCFTFSDKVDGYTRGEGCAMVILKRLADVTEEDKVWATIETGCNQDGGTVSPISAPSESQQLKLLEQLYAETSTDPTCIQYIEAHGTGTVRGDFAEVNALGKFFKKCEPKMTRYIGSVKTNIGHLESAAGTAGLIKILLMMKHSKIVPSLFFDNPNPNIDFKGMNFIVPTQVQKWSDQTKSACVSSFGFGGTNCHAIVQTNEKSAVTQINQNTETLNAPCIICFSGKSRESLRNSIEDFVSYPGIEKFSIQDISYTSTQRREHYTFRKAFISTDMADLLKSLDNYLHEEPLSEVKKPQVVFVCCGMGGDWVGMGRKMMKSSTVFKQAIQDIDRALSQFVQWSLEYRLNTEADQNDQKYWPVAVFACQVGLARLWKKFGIVPDCVIGHSMGEVAAAHISGRLSLEEAVRVIYFRSAVLYENSRPGRMIMIRNIPVAEARKALNGFAKDAGISTEISPVCCTVSGTPEAVEHIKSEVASRNLNAAVTDLPIYVGSHCPCVDPCLDIFDQMLGSVSATASTIDMVSTVTGNSVAEVGSLYWRRNLRAPVLFFDAIRKTYDEKKENIYIEVGPRPFMSSHVQDIFPDKKLKVIPSMTMRDSDFHSFLIRVQSLYELGCNVAAEGLEVTPVPRYSFQPRKTLSMSEDSLMKNWGKDHSKHWHPYVHKELKTEEYKLILSEQKFPSVFDHVVSSEVIVPGALYADVGFAVSKLEPDMNAPQYSVSVTFEEPCPIKKTELLILDIKIQMEALTTATKQRYKRYAITVMKGTITIANLHLQPLAAKEPERAINIDDVKDRCQEEIDKSAIYEKYDTLEFRYGPNYKLLTGARRCGSECLSDLEVPDVVCEEMMQTTIHPSILDAMFQTRVVLTNDEEREGKGYPLSFGKLTVLKPMEAKMCVYTTLKSAEECVTTFNMTLTSVTGEVIAEVKDVLYASITGRNDNPGNWAGHLQKSTWSPAVVNYKSKMKPMASMSAFALASKYMSYAENEINKKLDDLSGSTSQHTDYIVLHCNVPISDSQDGDSVQSEVLKVCSWLEQAFKQDLQMRFYLFTTWGMSADDKVTRGKVINPIMSAVWGFSRCAILEKVSDVVILDLHLLTDTYTPEFAMSVADLIHRDSALKTFRQWVVTEDDLLVWNVSPLRSESAQMPDYREIFADESRNMMLIYKEAILSSDVLNVYDETSTVRLQKSSTVELHVSQTVFPSHHLLETFIPHNTVHPGETIVHNGFAVISLERAGKVKDQENDDVICCYPSLTATKMVIPTEVLVEKCLFEDYSPGDLTTLVMLLSIYELVQRQSVTILTSFQTQGYASLLELMYSADSEKHEVNFVKAIDIHKKEALQILKPNIISLVRTDARTVSHLARGWSHAERFVAISPLMDEDARSLFSALLPYARLQELSGSSVFQHSNVMKIVPRLKKVLKDQSTKKQDISQFLKECRPSDQKGMPFDLSDLLITATDESSRSKVYATAEEMFQKNGVYIVVAGLSGLGWVFVNYLAEKGAGHIAIINRRAPKEDHMKAIDELCKLYTCSVKPFQADVTHWKELKNTITSIKQSFGNRHLRGVFFGPAVLKDQVFQNLDWDDFEKVISPKVKGAWNMHQLTKKEDLDFFICQSSIASVFGNIGQTNYATGNAFMDGLAHYRRYKGLPAQSINWGALDLGLLKGREKAIEVLESRGISLLFQDEIQILITPILLFNWLQTMPCKLNFEVWKKNRQVATPARQDQEVPASYEIVRRIKNANSLSEAERIELYTEYIIFQVNQILGVEDGDIKPESSLRDMGMDSLIAMTINADIQKTMNCKLPLISLVSGDPSPQIIAKLIDAKLCVPPEKQSNVKCS